MAEFEQALVFPLLIRSKDCGGVPGKGYRPLM